jgi:hypothetical protein
MSGRDYEAELKALMHAIADSVSDLEDDAIIEEVRADGIDPVQRAETIRSLLLQTVEDFKRRRLKEARAAYEERVKQARWAERGLPKTPAERRTLLERTLARRPSLRPALVTMQYREFSELVDQDVTSLLRHLQMLGALEDGEDSDE